ncbi:MAG TPA: polysulfide reductase NrfD [Clostridia bacterium]|nr:polysulfide reductase NrfD [Clostridia bacterium]
MSYRHDTWGWMLAVDFFFAGMGGAMLCIAGVVDLFGRQSGISLLGSFLGPICVGIGACFLLIELGRPFQGWRVFMNPKAILTFGAWNMLVAIAAGLWYASFGLAGLPWSASLGLRKVLAAIVLMAGFIVATYPGVLLGRHKSRPFWMGTGIMSLFCLSSFVTGFAAHLLCGLASWTANLPLHTFGRILALLLALQLVFWLGYLWTKSSGGTRWEADAARRWLRGDLAATFKYGFLLIGTLAPLILFLLPAGLEAPGAVLALLGGLIMRLLVVRAGEERTWLPGERLYHARLPVGNEDFLRAWDNK